MTPRELVPGLLCISGTVTLVYGYFTPWLSTGSFRLQDESLGGPFALIALVTIWGAFAIAGWLAYVALAHRGKPRHRSRGIAKLAIVTSALAAITLGLAIILLVAAYGAAIPHGVAEAPEELPHVTTSPWLVIEGSASLAVGGWLLWRVERAG